MEYKTEKEFLKNYNKDEYEKLSMTTDILIFSVSSEMKTNYRKNDKKRMSILLVKRDSFPYKDKWCLPGGFLDVKKETLEECAKRILKKETNLENIYLEQLYTFDSIDRDPRMRIVSTSFVALIDKNKLINQINKNACWFDVIDYFEKNNQVSIILSNGIENLSLNLKRELKNKTSKTYEYKSINNTLAFDHDCVVSVGLQRIRNKVNYTDIVFNMMGEHFTLKELQQVYEVILGKKLLDPAFRRIIKDKVVKTKKMEIGAGHRPSVLFKYNQKL